MKSQRQKREEAKARQTAYDKLSLKAKLALIETRPGESKREKNRILAKIK